MSIERADEVQSSSHYAQTTVPKFDMLVRGRIPAFGDIGLEVREWLDTPFQRLVFTGKTIAKLVVYLAFGVPLAQLCPALLGPWLLTGESFAMAVVSGLCVAVYRMLSEKVYHTVLEGLAFPILLYVGVRLATFSQEGALERGISVAFAVALGCLLVDRINTHYFYWLTSDACLLVTERDELRYQWHGRAKSLYLVQMALFAFFLWMTGVGSISWGQSLTIGWILTTLATFRPSPVVNLKTGLSAAFLACINWTTWGRHDDLLIDRTPGLFWSPSGSVSERQWISIFSILALSVVLSPNIFSIFADLGGLSVWNAAAHVVLAMTFPFLMVLLGVGITAGRRLALLHEDLEGQLDVQGTQLEWRRITESLRGSPNALAREHLFLGYHYHALYPVLVHSKLLWEHMHILGASGSGKTSRGLLPLITQLVERNDGAVIVLDLKGDNLLFQGTRAVAGMRFKHFTNMINRSTHLFNPFNQLRSGTISINQFCEIVLGALRLNHGDGYGRSYYSRMARLWLADIMLTHPGIQSFHDLYQHLKKRPPKGPAGQDARMLREECFELISVIHSLSTVEALNWQNIPNASAAPLAAQIYLPEVLAKKEVVYFNLPDSQESFTVREIANLVLFSTFEAARASVGSGQRIYLIIDEFQNIASRAFERIVREARGFNMTVILSHQSLADLETIDAPELESVVQQNTQVKQFFSATEPRLQQYLLDCAGQTLGIQYGFTRRGVVNKIRMRDWVQEGTEPERTTGRWILEDQKLEDSMTATEVVIPRMNLNDILQYSSSPDTSIVLFGRDSGFTAYGGHWFAIRSPYSLALAEKELLESLPWPNQTSETISAGVRSSLHTPFLTHSTGNPSPSPIAKKQKPGMAKKVGPKPIAQAATASAKSPATQSTPKPTPPAQPQSDPRKAFWMKRLKQAHAAQQGVTKI
jgi:hypothetical protein